MESSQWASPPVADPIPAVSAAVTDVIPPQQTLSDSTEPNGGTALDDRQYDVPAISDPTLAAMDEFAQTRPPDDLFADDFTLMDEPVVEDSPVVHEIPQPVEGIANGPRQPRERGGRRGVRGGGRHAASGTNHRPTAETQLLQQQDDAPTPDAAEVTQQPTEAPRAQPVRGDRSKTGGVKKAKLTEDELSARMEAIKLKNASLEAAHARAEADQASFNAREVEAQQRRRLERQNRQQMMGEREKNRLRKLNALGGREWDAEKDADDQAHERDGRSNFRRGAYGGVAPSDTGQAAGSGQWHGDDEAVDPPADQPSRGDYGARGRGRGRGGGVRGRGRGGSNGGWPVRMEAQAVPTANDFPALASTAKAAAAAAPAGGAADSSWAEEMEETQSRPK